MSDWPTWAVPVVAALLTAAAAALAVPVLTRRGVLDVPGHRSLHDSPVPRGGGVAVLAGAVVSVLWAATAAQGGRLWLASAALGISTLALLGLVDDLRSLSFELRLAVQAAVGAGWGVVLVLGSHASLAWLPLVVLVTVVLVNATNFMDGANGLVPGHAVVAGAWYSIVAAHLDEWGAMVLALAVAGAAAGFLPFNAPTARLFLGDVGSYALGGSWAVLSTWLVIAGAPAAAVLAPMAVVLADTGATLARRAVAGDPVTSPHRLHVYQRLVRGGWTHSRVAVVVSSLTAAVCLAAVPSLLAPTLLGRIAAYGAVGAVGIGYLLLPSWVGESARWRVVRSTAW